MTAATARSICSTGISVIVASRGRPRHLIACLDALGAQRQPPLEVVVVADPAGLSAVAGAKIPTTARGGIRSIPFDRPNVALARNRGIAAARGAVAAFVDDDSEAEPGWLGELGRAFSDPAIGAAAGYVLNGDGVGFQCEAEAVGRSGLTRPIAGNGTDPFRPHLGPDEAVSLIGTNCAVRLTLLRRLGGFDAAFAYYLDDADLAMRLAAIGAGVAVVPTARVRHHRAASALRRGDGTPTDMHVLGRSVAAFLARHCPAERRSAARRAHARVLRRRLFRRLRAGRCPPGEVFARLVELHRGLRADPTTTASASDAADAADLAATAENGQENAATLIPMRKL